MSTILCIGGPADGERIFDPNPGSPVIALARPMGAGYYSFTYRRERLRGRHDEFEVFVHDLTADGMIEKLIDAYPNPVKPVADVTVIRHRALVGLTMLVGVNGPLRDWPELEHIVTTLQALAK